MSGIETDNIQIKDPQTGINTDGTDTEAMIVEISPREKDETEFDVERAGTVSVHINAATPPDPPTTAEMLTGSVVVIPAIDDIESGRQSPTKMCPICMDTLDDRSVQLSCGHEFCKDCAIAYVKSGVGDGNTDFGCIVVSGEPGAFKTCNENFTDSVVLDLLQNDEKMMKRFQRFKFLKNQNARECPKCENLQLGCDDKHEMICNACQNEFCFIHGGAHSGKSCEEYEESTAEETKATYEMLGMNSKQCPGCGIYVSKTSGCNHMKCTQCKASFCWVCGKKITDDVFPHHFQWWNPTGCANMQMSEDVAPSAAVLRRGKIMACLQTMAVGLCTVSSALLTFLLCGICCIRRGETKSETCINARTVCGQHMTAWGGVWLFILVISPVAIIVGAFYLVFWIVMLIINVVLILAKSVKRLFKKFALGDNGENENGGIAEPQKLLLFPRLIVTRRENQRPPQQQMGPRAAPKLELETEIADESNLNIVKSVTNLPSPKNDREYGILSHSEDSPSSIEPNKYASLERTIIGKDSALKMVDVELGMVPDYEDIGNNNIEFIV